MKRIVGWLGRGRRPHAGEVPPFAPLADEEPPLPPVAPVPAHDVKAWVRSGLGAMAARHGFRPARGAPDGWVRECGEGVLQTIHLSWVMRLRDRHLIASVRVGHHLVEAERLWARCMRLRYAETFASLGDGLASVLPAGDRRDWKFPRSHLAGELLDQLAAALEHHGIPFLERYRTREQVFAEIERRYLAEPAPQFARQIHFSCFEFAFGHPADAIARVEAALAALPPEGAGEALAARRREGEFLLAHYRGEP